MNSQIRVGRRVYNNSGSFTDPSFEGFENIFCLTKSSEYGSLSPYLLKNNHGHIMENIWQFAKIYQKVPESKQKYSRYDSTVIWDHKEEIHAINTNNTFIPTLAYKKWRQKGMECKYPIRYPVGFNNRNLCIGSIKSSEYNKCIFDENYVPKLLTYIEARKEIYLKTFLKLVKKENDYTKLINKLKNGKNLLIIEVDGPHGEDLEYYKTKYEVGDDFITNNTILVTSKNIDIMLNDRKHPFGHGYCLGIALINDLK
jgi:hypothetical protein